MSDDLREHEVREFLRRMVTEMPVQVEAPPSAIGRARRRLVMSIAAALTVVVLATTVAVSALRAVGSSNVVTPASSTGATGASGVTGGVTGPPDSTTIPDGGSFDFDPASAGGVADVTWVGGNLQPAPGAWVASADDAVPFGGGADPGQKLYDDLFSPVALGPDQLQVGALLGVFTDQGRYVQAKVLDRSASALVIQWLAGPPSRLATPCRIGNIEPTGGVDGSGAAIVTSGTVTLCGTSFGFDLDTGTTGDTAADLYRGASPYHDVNTNDDAKTNEGTGRGIVDLGYGVNFDALSLGDIQRLDFSGKNIVADGMQPSKGPLTPGDVFAVWTSDGNFSKVELLGYQRAGYAAGALYTMNIRFVTYQG